MYNNVSLFTNASIIVTTAAIDNSYTCYMLVVLDYILVYKLEDMKYDRKHKSSSAEKRASKRAVFLENLVNVYGLELEPSLEEIVTKRPQYYDDDVHFIKVHCPWEPLIDGADRIGLKMPVKCDVRNILLYIFISSSLIHSIITTCTLDHAYTHIWLNHACLLPSLL